MRNLIVFCLTTLLSQAASAQQAAATPAPVHFQVWGNCSMCKKTIEKAANGVAGVDKAEWNVDTHQFTAVFDPAKTGVDKVHQSIAAAGYDTEMIKGSDAAYNGLHGCCQYERRN